MTNDAARILDRARDESPDVLDEIVAETRDFSPSQAMERLHQLAEYSRLSGRQRVEQALMATKVQTAARALSACQNGDTATFDQAHRTANQVPGQLRQTGPVGRYTTQAHRVLDALHGRGLPDHAAAAVDGLIRHPAGAADQVDAARDLAARWLAVCGSPQYESAFARILADPMTGGATLDEGEREAWRAARQIQSALGESGTGSYMVPTMIDPAILLSNAGANNPLRQVARVEQIVTSEWHGITSAGVTAEWTAEAAEAADASPVLASPGVPVHKLDAFTPFSLELEGDVPSLMSQLSGVLVNAADLLSGSTFTTGDGVGKPSGFVPNVTGVDNASGAFVSGDVFTTQNALPPRFTANASWLANIAVHQYRLAHSRPAMARCYSPRSAPATRRRCCTSLSAS